MDLGARKRQEVSSKVTRKGGREREKVCVGLGGKEEVLESWGMCRQEVD